MTRSKRLLLWTSIVMAGAAFWIGWAIFRNRAEEENLVGAWQGDLYPDTFYEFRADGTYRSSSKEGNYRGDVDVTFRSEGTYTYSGGAIHFKVKQARATGLSSKNQRYWDRQSKTPFSMPVEWRSQDDWRPARIAMGGFHRIKSLP